MDRSDWDERYRSKDLVWGAEANRFVSEAFADAPSVGRALDVACGEGRNAIWLASKGWRVTAVDFSAVAIDRGRELAARAGVDVDWVVDDVVGWRPEPDAFDRVVIAYLQIPMAPLGMVLDHSAAALSRGGELFMVGHAVQNLSEGVGGPSDPRVLWDADGLAGMLGELGLSVDRCETVLRPVAGEDGPRSAVDVVARATRR